MPKWNVVLERDVSICEQVEVTVEAKTEEEAETLALEKAKSGSLYWDCVGYCDNYIDVVEIEPLTQ